MKAHGQKAPGTESKAAASILPLQQKGEQEPFQVEDHRSETVTQRQLQGAADDSRQVKQGKVMQAVANSSPVLKQLRIIQAMANRHKSAPRMNVPVANETKKNVQNGGDGWHVAQRVKTTAGENVNAGSTVDKTVQKKAASQTQHVFFRQEMNSPGGKKKQAVGATGMTHLYQRKAAIADSTSGMPVQRAKLKVANVDYNPDTRETHDFNINHEKTTGILNTALANTGKVINDYRNGLKKAYAQVNDDENIEISAGDIPSLAAAIVADLSARYINLNRQLGPMSGGAKNALKTALHARLDNYMQGRAFGHGFQSDKQKHSFNQFLNGYATAKSQNKGIPGEVPAAALGAFDNTARQAATNAAANYANIKGASAPGTPAAAREVQARLDQQTMQGIRSPHHNNAGWLPPLLRPAKAPWKQAKPDHSHKAAFLWFYTEAAPSYYLEFDGGNQMSRIVYDPINDISYATMHYASINGLNPFFKLV